MIATREQVTPSFSFEDFCYSCPPRDLPVRVRSNLVRLAWNLEVIREQLACPLEIVSGYRSPDENSRAQGASDSYHLAGQAADLLCPSRPIGYLYAVIEALAELGRIDDGGIGLYAAHVHYDCRRAAPARFGRAPHKMLLRPRIAPGLSIDTIYTEGRPILATAIERKHREASRSPRALPVLLGGLGAAAAVGFGALLGAVFATGSAKDEEPGTTDDD